MADAPEGQSGGRPRGPWDAAEAPARPAPVSASAGGWAGGQGGSLVWNLVSTAILFGWIWWNLGWAAAVALVVGVFVHEYGHVLAINAAGCGPGRIHIVPFLGGAATPARPPESEFKGVLIALAGPVFGLLAAAPFVAAFSLTGENRWLVGALMIVVINVLNLVPAPPLDGSKVVGPALARLHPWLEKAVIVAVAALVVWWAVSHGSWLTAALITVAALVTLRSPLRAAGRPLSWAEALWSMLLWLAALGLCAGAFLYVIAGPHLPADPVALFHFVERAR